MSSVPPGSLAVVGTGIRAGHLTPESRAAVLAADVLFYLAADENGGGWLERLNPEARSLHSLYHEGEPRQEAYERMVEAILAPVAEGRKVCAAFYGHPGVFVTPSHEAVRRARALGAEARMLPAVSAEDCLFADLGIDPGRSGCQSYEATSFLADERPVDSRAHLILWQVSVVGEPLAVAEPSRAGLRTLTDRLLREYPADHEVVVYEASPYPLAEPLVLRVPLERLPDVEVTPMATLVVPPASRLAATTLPFAS